MIDKKIYSKKVAELKKYKKIKKESSKSFYTRSIPIILICFILSFFIYFFWDNPYSKEIPLIILFIFFVFCVLDTKKSPEYVNKMKKIEKEENENIARILEFVGYRRISKYDFPMPTSLVRIISDDANFLSDEYFKKAMENIYEFGKFKFIDDSFEGVIFHVDMTLPVQDDIFIGDFSKNSLLCCIDTIDDWKFFTQNKNENLEWITPEFRRQIEQIIPLFSGEGAKISDKHVFLQIKKDGINGFLPGLFPFNHREWIDIKNEDITFDDAFSLYKSASVLEEFNKYIEENKF
ncbi:MAG: hypothetical protein J6Y03_00735 [Alphaproteobacteria bacterium]|nr:hypothetical protein [Alphaproteobacteria bacterium]